MSAEDARSGSGRRSVLVVTVSYRTAKLVENSLVALARERATRPDVDIRAFVIDNASGDAPAIERAIADRGFGDFATLIESPTNGGFSFGNNRGFEHAYRTGSPPDYFLLLNPDAEVLPDGIGALVRFLDEHPLAAVAGSQLQFQDGTPWPYAFRFPSIWSELNTALSTGIVSKLLSEVVVTRRMGPTPTRVDWLPGASMMVRRAAIEEVGGLDESYFLYFEELDFFVKLARAGWETWYVPDSKVMHISGQSSGVTARDRVGPLPDYWFESRRRYFAKNHGVPYAMLTDAVTIPAFVVGRLKRKLQGRARENTPGFTRSLFRHSILRSPLRPVLPSVEYRPANERRDSPKDRT
jgi:N-acetylglucosaminyl-diphospho-decaprenol L-rhamnosyltransferase